MQLHRKKKLSIEKLSKIDLGFSCLMDKCSTITESPICLACKRYLFLLAVGPRYCSCSFFSNSWCFPCCISSFVKLAASSPEKKNSYTIHMTMLKHPLKATQYTWRAPYTTAISNPIYNISWSKSETLIFNINIHESTTGFISFIWWKYVLMHSWCTKFN